MPYQSGTRLPQERAGKLGHLEVIKSDLVNSLCHAFEDVSSLDVPNKVDWIPINLEGQKLPIVLAVDGSLQVLRSETPPYKEVAFVKTALLKLDTYALEKVDKRTPHPFELRDIMAESAVYHATVFPLKHLALSGTNLYNAVRRIIFDSFADASLERQPLETLKWIAYEKWDGIPKSLDSFECPHCEENVASLPYDVEIGRCQNCGGELFVTDMLGFHLDMAPDTISDSVATAYMNLHEIMMLFTGIRYFWENSRNQLPECLFVKDGPLSIRAQYSKLVAPIRRFIAFAYANNCPVHLIGQEKSGKFWEHLEMIGQTAPSPSIFIPHDEYIKSEIHHRPNRGALYGKDTNFGAKTFLKLSDYHQMVISVPTDRKTFHPAPQVNDLVGFQRIAATLPTILSSRHEGGLLPIELAHGVASLSTYPSARILRLFAGI